MSRIEGRTVLEFQSAADVWGTLDSWAEEKQYKLKAQDGMGRVYQKGKNLALPPMTLSVVWTGAAYRLEAWVRFPMINRISSFGMLPAEAVIASEGGKIGFIPRDKMRKELNELLDKLGIPRVT